jgi:hypothetical protein
MKQQMKKPTAVEIRAVATKGLVMRESPHPLKWRHADSFRSQTATGTYGMSNDIEQTLTLIAALVTGDRWLSAERDLGHPRNGPS